MQEPIRFRIEASETVCTKPCDVVRWAAPALWLVFLFAGGVRPALAQLGSPGCVSTACVNPVPCEHCTGTWTDDVGAVWTVTSDLAPTWGTWGVTGSLSAPIGPGCPRASYSVEGWITQTWGSDSVYGATSFHWRAFNPAPYTPCGGLTPQASITYDGNIENNGCDKGSGTWTNSSGLGGSFSVSKPPEIPWGESTTAVGWSSVYGGSVQQWRQVLQGFGNFAGRQVTESPTGGDLDTCNFAGSGVDNYHVTGGTWNVGFWFWDSTWGDDYVGWSGDRVTFYRSNGRPPCSASAGQGMNITIQGRSGALQNYLFDGIGTGLPDYATVTSSRAGQTVSRTWP